MFKDTEIIEAINEEVYSTDGISDPMFETDMDYLMSNGDWTGAVEMATSSRKSFNFIGM